MVATVAVLPLYGVWLAFFATGGGDLAAQEAWAGFASRHPGSPYNLFWYGGLHPANYSVISPYLMAACGVKTVTLVAGLAGSWLAGTLLVRAGVRWAVWPALLASLALWCNVVSGRTTFALGVAFGLAAWAAVLRGPGLRPRSSRRSRLVVAAVCSVLATMASPVAGLFLVVLGAGFLLVRDWARAVVLFGPPCVVVAVTTYLFPFDGVQPMPLARIWPPVLFAVVVGVAAPR
ncbi:hypothetical protein U9R90_34295, partial [Streptomyces sp. E11-3]